MGAQGPLITRADQRFEHPEADPVRVEKDRERIAFVFEKGIKVPSNMSRPVDWTRIVFRKQYMAANNFE